MTLEEAKKRITELDSGSNFLGSDYEAGWEDALCRATEILDEIDTEPVRNPDKMTLKELARELRKLFKFKYLTAHRRGVELFLRMYAKEPSYFKTYSVWGEADAVFFPIAVSEDLRVDIDLSEYKDADGNIDYSKCIVEVEE